MLLFNLMLYHVHMMYLPFQQLWTVALWLTQPMAELVTVVGQHLDRQPPTDVIQATTWLEAVVAHVKLQEGGLEVHLPVTVCSLFIILTLLARRACAEIDRVVTREANKKWRFSVVLIHCVISFKIAEFRQ